MDVQEFSEYEKTVIVTIVAWDEGRNEWENYIGIPVLSFMSRFFAQKGLYLSIDEDVMLFASSLKSEDKMQQELIDNQRMVIFALHLLAKLKQKGYIVCLNLGKDSFEATKASVPLYGIPPKLKEMKIKFSLDELQGINRELISQAIIVTEDLKNIVAQGFKTLEQIRYENEIEQMHIQIDKADTQIEKANIQIDKANKQINWAIRSFWVAILALIISLYSVFYAFKTSNNNITQQDLHEIFDSKKMPDIVNTKLTNDTIKAIIVNYPLPKVINKPVNKQTSKK